MPWPPTLLPPRRHVQTCCGGGRRCTGSRRVWQWPPLRRRQVGAMAAGGTRWRRWQGCPAAGAPPTATRGGWRASSCSSGRVQARREPASQRRQLALAARQGAHALFAGTCSSAAHGEHTSVDGSITQGYPWVPATTAGMLLWRKALHLNPLQSQCCASPASVTSIGQRRIRTCISALACCDRPTRSRPVTCNGLPHSVRGGSTGPARCLTYLSGWWLCSLHGPVCTRCGECSSGGVALRPARSSCHDDLEDTGYTGRWGPPPPSPTAQSPLHEQDLRAGSLKTACLPARPR